MPSAENMSIALNILLTGLVVVFSALIVLTFVIKGYGAIVTALTGRKKKSTPKAAPPAPPAAPKAAPKAAAKAPAAPAVQQGIPGEVIAAIAAAVPVRMLFVRFAVYPRTVPHGEVRVWQKIPVLSKGIGENNFYLQISPIKN